MMFEDALSVPKCPQCGYKSASDYWIRAWDATANWKTYHDALVSGTLTQTTNYTHGSDAYNPTSLTQFNQNSSRYSGGGGSNLSTSSGFPSGQIGLYSTVAGSSMNEFLVTPDTAQRDMAGRWINKSTNRFDLADGYTSFNPSTGRLDLPLTAISKPIYLKNLRLKKFCLTFGMQRNHGDPYCSASVFFNGVDQDTCNNLVIYHANSPIVPYSYTGGATTTLANVPTMTNTSLQWCNITFDGTTLTVKLQGGTSEPAFSSWASVGTCYSNTNFPSNGGLIGFGTFNAYPSISAIKVRSYDTATSAFDILEHVETGALDTSGFTTGDTLTNDSNGNLTFDGTATYTYDAWNRLKSIAHAYRDGSGTLSSGQTSEVNSYDAQGRRIAKAISNTGAWDCTYNYYLDRQSVVEEQNGSAQTIKQFLWGLDYIDELIQTSLNSSPTTKSTCDVLYWACQDANWNVLGIVSSTGVLTERYEYSPYGQRQVFTSAGSNDPMVMGCLFNSNKFVISSVAQPYGLCEVGHQGLFHDEESGLIYVRSRHLENGRWMQRDNAYRGGLNLDEALGSNPIRAVDPSGRDSYFLSTIPSAHPRSDGRICTGFVIHHVHRVWVAYVIPSSPVDDVISTTIICVCPDKVQKLQDMMKGLTGNFNSIADAQAKVAEVQAAITTTVAVGTAVVTAGVGDIVLGAFAADAASAKTAIAIVQDGKVLTADATGLSSHAALAQQAGVLVSAPGGGVAGVLAPGAEAVTIVNEGGQVSVLGSSNFQGVMNVSDSAKAAVIAAMGQ
jgi:RHS repeat-associated protein